MRRGLLKDLANTPTQMACGWRLYGDLPQLRELVGSVISVDLLTGTATIGEQELSPGLEVADETCHWLRGRFERDGVPAGTVAVARLTLRPRGGGRGSLVVECSTLLQTASETYESSDTTRWHRDDCLRG